MAYTSYEIEFLPVGAGERSGDAIVGRFVADDGSWRTIVIDGGTKESGEAVVHHVRHQYQTDLINDVVNTHPDADHASGLRVVLENMRVETLWMHRPWDHSADIKHLFGDGRITAHGLSARIKDALVCAHDVHKLAARRGILQLEPFVGATIGPFTVLSPSLPFYRSLLPVFRCTPEPVEQAALQRTIRRVLSEKLGRIAENWGFETLREGGETSAENESSVVLYGEVGGSGILLTGDAGLRALSQSMAAAAAFGFDLKKLGLVQIPHHGSRNNVSPSILNQLLGPKLFGGGTRSISAIVSAATGSETHPRRVVTNAFSRRGCDVFQTKGTIHRNCLNMPIRSGWSVAEKVPFYSEVEPYD